MSKVCYYFLQPSNLFFFLYISERSSKMRQGGVPLRCCLSRHVGTATEEGGEVKLNDK